MIIELSCTDYIFSRFSRNNKVHSTRLSVQNTLVYSSTMKFPYSFFFQILHKIVTFPEYSLFYFTLNLLEWLLLIYFCQDIGSLEKVGS